MPNIVSAGENSILIYFGDKIDASLPKNIANFANQLKNEMGGVVINLIPSYTSLHVSYDLNVIDYQDFVNQVEQCLKQNQNTASALESKTIRIPVYYGLEVGLDLERLLQEKNLDLDAFINVHSSKEYLVYAIGFSPVFAFLGEVDERIQLPRLNTPRIKIPAGSVGIAESQTAIYPSDSSGGWNIVGRTPIDLSLNNLENIDKFNVGNQVKFDPISRDEYLSSGGKL
ncbi:MAG: 5-oxoprolinase subunit PxpB [Candidatus Thioglobus sp.]|jgi:KipI family sensor histidine kinase inhibitor|uniref:5-oxoprolinase subunit PxpB n=1 Tax=Candidatus Thioglobus sp. TaxID=2026721 RepID=UPI0001BD3835|nr:5-oxoprolinase subunit PxpB [Candidatus Thioglobus sp.]EEZ79934.1 MAG: allophanate hydrolase subunit 1 [uncultured Candidatus Thioglobus sp.]MBT3186362.1 5-oxoprolinase subunit PxpB [Candidatus Thioglobus sp.]MBT3431983.1 5-oxoprolinase subunit PxpB [Candidatus Thioglobus sp.]MBT3964895.1 5-oxoprolinase subunit PxpB [Candidatus Thioglobus sp.]MBT4315599.1 5-oxoprolinase subunit PxpB [Candidatus Thioglobus sp.]